MADTLLYASKLATVLLTPLGFALALGLLGLSFRRVWGAHGLVLAALLLLWCASMPATARFALGTLESRYPNFAAMDAPAADAAIVLGGAIGAPIPPRHAPELQEASDRILYAAQLFKAGKVKAILVSGGNLPWSTAAEPEAETIRGLLVSWGVPADVIFTGGASRTTAENAREVKEMWPRLGFSSALLVTSAAHMPRAYAAFKKAGLPVTPAPADIRIVSKPFDLLDLLPDAGALAETSNAAKEAAGYLVYWLRGDL